MAVAGASFAKRPSSTSEFKYWKQEMIQIVKLWEAPPERICQTLRNTRDPGQFFTLWVAIVGVFALTILFGILATVYSVKQYRVGVKSYELALALACLDQPTLPSFCVT